MMVNEIEMLLGAALWAMLLGLLGQVLRAVGGMKKVSDAAAAAGVAADQLVSGWRLVVSLGLGALSGLLAAVSARPPEAIERPGHRWSVLRSLIGAPRRSHGLRIPTCR